jgi:uncharacterized protein YndB with AHSA1/START domain
MPNVSGIYEQIQGAPVIRFERTFPHPVGAVWGAITDPVALRDWFPTTVEFSELRPGQPIDFRFETHDLPPMTGEIRAVDAPHRFVFTWGDDELTFELSETDGGRACRLAFTVVLDDAGKAARDGAGWENCLDRLDRVAGGETPERPDRGDSWSALYEEYKRLGFPATAEIPQ